MVGRSRSLPAHTQSLRATLTPRSPHAMPSVSHCARPSYGPGIGQAVIRRLQAAPNRRKRIEKASSCAKSQPASCRVGGRRRHLDAGGFHGGDLRLRIAFAAGNDRAGMAHAPSRRRRAAGDEADHRLLAAGLASSMRNWAASSSAEPPISPIMMIDSVALSARKQFQHVDEVRALDRIAADADARWSGRGPPGSSGRLPRRSACPSARRYRPSLA